MNSLECYRQIICNILTEHTRVPYSYGEIDFELVFDKENGRYLLMLVGREENGKRVHGCLIHIDIIDSKLWIQPGVPKEHIVLGFRSLELRKQTEFAAA